MIRIAALNDSLSSDGSQSEDHVREVTKEAKEAEAFDLYSKALEFLRHREVSKAEDAFHDLVDHEFLIEAFELLEEKGKDAIHPGLQLLYSIQKNLAAMATKRKDHATALDCYLEAVKIDDSEVTVWYKIGVTALALEDFQLAMLSFEHGLDCNPKHWPCLDNVITILFALSNYVECLYYISKAFELEVHYNKGYAFKDKIFSEQRSLERDTEEFFRNCDPEIKTICIDSSEAQEYIDEALEMRRRHSIVCQPPEPALLHFPERIKQYSWNHIGDILTKLYDKAMSDNTYSLALRVKVPDYKNLPELDEEEVDVDVTVETEEAEKKTDNVEGDPHKLVTEELITNTDDVVTVSKKEDSKLLDEAMDCDGADERKPIKDISSTTGSRFIESKMETEPEYVNKLVDESIELKSETSGKIDDANAKCVENKISDNSDQNEISDNKEYPIASTNIDLETKPTITPENVTGFENSKDGSNDKPDVEIDCKKERMEVDDVPESSNMNQDNDMKPFSTDNDLESKVNDDASKEVSENIAEPDRPAIEGISDEDSSSICEAMSVAHALLDSLSPGKSRETYVIPNSPRHSKPTASPLTVSSAARKAGVVDGKSNSQSEGLTKTSSYGFAVTELFPEDTAVSSENENQIRNISAKAYETTNSNIKSEKLDLQTSTTLISIDTPIMAESSLSSQRLPGPAHVTVSSASSDVKCSPSVVPTGSNVLNTTVPSVVILSPPVMLQGIVSPCTLSQSVTCSMSTAVSALMSQTSAPVTCSMSTAVSAIMSQTSAPVTCSMSTAVSAIMSQTSAPVNVGSDSLFQLSASSGQMIMTQSGTKSADTAMTIVPVSIAEHGYSRSYSEMPIYQSTPRKLTGPSMILKSPGQTGAIVLEDSASSASFIEIPMEIDDRSPSGRKSQKRKRPPLATEDVINYGKRRSARVRNTGGRKKEEETVNFSDLLHTFLPSSIKNAQDDENVSLSTEGSEAENTEQKSGSEKASGSNSKTQTVAMVTEEWNEVEMVKSFLDKYIKNTGLLDMCCSYLHIMARHFLVKWPKGLCEMYLSLFQRIRQHLYIPRTYEMNDSPELYQKLAQICLVQVELQLDAWVVSRSKVTGTVLLSPRSFGSHALSKDEIPAFYKDDVTYLTTLCCHRDTLGSIWMDHCVRVYWMKARFALLRNKMEEALYCFDMIKEYLEFGKKELNVESAYIPNCQIDNFVDLETVVSQYELLQQTRSVEETEKLYEKRDYKKVVEVLLQNFTADKQKSLKQIPDIQERQSQIIMLLEALFKTEDYEKCLFWGEESFNECYCMYKQACKSDARSCWVKTMITVFSYIHRAVKKDLSIMKCLESTKTLRFSKNLIKVIDVNMALPESIVEMAIDSVLPWILLYHVIKQEEERLEQTKIAEEANTEKEENVSSSQMLLNIAHESLGSRCWCTKSDGALLVFYMSLLRKEMTREPATKFLEEYQQSFEQCVYCMFGHPNKKGKAKHLQDHNAANITLRWEYCIDVFDYFKPRTLPEFDGYRSETITAELENLLKRIIPLIPDTSKSMGVTEEQIRTYIEGTINSPPMIQDGRSVTLPVVDEIHYLLGDYYLKNKEHGKAIKFYIQDLCMNPSHLDAWAGMALARMSQLDTKLASADMKMNTPIYKKCIPALRCFKRAVEIDDSNSKLWIEYGTLAYQLHSHASRQLQWLQKKWFEMDEEFVKTARDSKQEMLQTATECFKMAADCDWSEDAWLHNYMLGKCADKAEKDTKESLAYYFKALECLHGEKAKYPRRIVYAYTTPHLAVEALEMFYRIHVTILKVLLKHGPESSFHDYKLYVKYIVNAANSPFVNRVEKGQTSRTDRDPASSADESSCLEPATKKSKQPSSDHTYFKNTNLLGNKKSVDVEKSVSMATVTSQDDLPIKSVTTLELYAEDQNAKVDVTMTTPEKIGVLGMKSPQPNLTPVAAVGVDASISRADGDSANSQEVIKSPFSIENLIGKDINKVESANRTNVESGAGDGVQSIDITSNKSETDNKSTCAKSIVLSAGVNQVSSMEIGHDLLVEHKIKSETIDESDAEIKLKGNNERGDTEREVKNVISHIEDLIEAEMAGGLNSSTPASVENTAPEDMEVNDEDFDTETSKLNPESQSSASFKENTKIDDQINVLLKLSHGDLHRELVDRCRLALVTCLERFPTHYKSHYRLAFLYLHSPYHKDLTKVHHLLLGAPKWQQLDYMPCQGLFGERKQTKFFQGIWKIPIDEIDRSGSFPSHLNRCIELALQVLKIEKDSQTLHQVHLQLNRQPEAGKKYLRDMEKKYYALISHEYTLDAVEMQIEDMKVVTNVEERTQFLMTVYKIYEHGVHKLNKHADRTNELLAEAYRVVLRKYETLPLKMLLAEAVRYCKHQITQKHKDKAQDHKSAVSASSSAASSPVSSATLTIPKQPLKVINLDNIMKSQTNSISLLKTPEPVTSSSNLKTGQTEKGMKSDDVAGESVTNDGHSQSDVIILSDSSTDTPVKSVGDEKKPDLSNVQSKPLPNQSNNAPTVKIKMGLLQAVKRLKPSTLEGYGALKVTSGDIDTSQDEAASSAVSENESEAPIPSAFEDEEVRAKTKSVTSSSSSSPSSSSSSDSSSDSSDADSSDDEEETSDKDDDGEESYSDEKQSDRKGILDGSGEVTTDNTVLKQTVKKIVPTTEDEEESSDNAEEIDLISSDDEAENDDDKDKDYNASEEEEDDDVIMISDEEFGPKGKAVIPSPPHTNIPQGTEVLVKDVPDFNASLISSLMMSEVDLLSAGPSADNKS